ncbi:hypothetical protein KW805_00075 [Candidatus Pacearchaeota archaeon]|nr:hypothetical protein [Candidatus Pacearchaeota archaeon]
MAEKHYDADWAKAKSRGLVKDMIQKTILTFRRPQDLKVLCLPGRDAAEVYEVYDPLGISRYNIIGLERDRSIAEEIEGKGLGIKVINKSLEEYVDKNHISCLDVVSLDFTGYLQSSQLDALRKICKKYANTNWILHWANSIKRDGASNNLYVRGAANDFETAVSKLSDFINKENSPDNSIAMSTANVMEEFQKKISNGELSKDEKALSALTLVRATTGGEYLDGIGKIFKFCTGNKYEGYIQQLEQEMGREIDRENPYKSIGYHPIVRDMLDEISLTSIKQAAKENKIDPLFISTIWSALEHAASETKGFVPKDTVTYSYISESGNPMVGNVSFLSHNWRYDKAAKELARAIGFPNKMNLKEDYQFLMACKKASDAMHSEGRSPEDIKNMMKKEKEIVFLGSSSRPVLSKQRFVEELENGMSLDQIKEKYRGWENKPLPQWKAHVTMGSYKSKDLVEEADEDSDLEKITKEQAVDLLSSGIPAEEIHAAYPTSFSTQQLRAYKAHVTMGTYKNGKEE